MEPEEQQPYLVRALDGQAKRWMFDSRWYELAAGEEKVFTMGPALQAVAHYTTSQDGHSNITVEAVPYSGKTSLTAVQQQQFQDEDGTVYATLPELIEAVKARTTAESQRKPEDTDEDLSGKTYDELVSLAKERGLTPKKNASRDELLEALKAGK